MGRALLILLIVVLLLLGLLFGLDRAAAGYAAGRIAAKFQAAGFPVKPQVSIEGFPFLTQVISGHLDGIDVVAPRFPAGPVTARAAPSPGSAAPARSVTPAWPGCRAWPRCPA